VLFRSSGPDAAPVPRQDSADLNATGTWKDGRWQVVFRRARTTESPADISFEDGQYVPIAFANWDGLAGDKGARHSFTQWYWVQLEPAEDNLRLYGYPALAGLLAALLFLAAARAQGRRYRA